MTMVTEPDDVTTSPAARASLELDLRPSATCGSRRAKDLGEKLSIFRETEMIA